MCSKLFQTHCSRRKEWFHGPSGEPGIFHRECNTRGEEASRTKHDISSADEKDVELIMSWSEGCPVRERVDDGRSSIIYDSTAGYICQDRIPVHSNQLRGVDRAGPGRPTSGFGAVTTKRRDTKCLRGGHYR